MDSVGVINWAVDHKILTEDQAMYCSGRMSGELTTPHGGSHPDYNEAVKDELCDFMKSKKGKPTNKELEKFVDEIRDGKRGDNVIKDHNNAIKDKMKDKRFDDLGFEETKKRGRGSFNRRSRLRN